MMPQHPHGSGRGPRVLFPILLVGTLLFAYPRAASSQVAPVAIGTGAGLVVGTYTTTAIYVLKARFGSYLFSLGDAVAFRPEVLPVLITPAAGAWLGSRSTKALERAGLWGGLGFAGGAALGAVAGEVLWKDTEGRWAGAIVGSAAGLLVGVALGAVDGLDETPGEPIPVLSIRVPLGGS